MNESFELQVNEDNSNDTDPQSALLISFTTGDSTKFEDILKYGSIDINHLYPDRDNQTLLEIACSSENRSKFIQLLLEYGADVNFSNKVHGKAPIHWAISSSNYDAVRLLMENNNILINKPDSSGKTAIQLATQLGNEEFVELLKRHPAIKFNTIKRGMRAKVQSDTLNGHPERDDKENQIETEDILFALLDEGNYQAFVDAANTINVHCDGNGQYTYLQYACKFGLSSIVRVLLDLGVDPNKITPTTRETPIMLSAYNGYFDIVQMLVETGKIKYDLIYGVNILQVLFIGVLMRQKKNKGYDSVTIFNLEFYKCLEYLLNHIPRSEVDVNLLNQSNTCKTVLHYAIFADNRNVIRLLLERGAYIGLGNADNEMPIKLMKADTLKYFIDKNLTCNGHITRIDYKIVIDFNMLVCKNTDEAVTETKPLVAISEVPQLRPLLSHPFFMAFLDLKWYMIMNKITIVNLLFYFIFVLCHSSYLLSTYAPITTKLNSQSNTTDNENYGDRKDTIGLLWYVVALLNTILFSREFFQFVVYSTANKYRYIKNVENWVEVALITVTYVILFSNIQSAENRSLLTVAAIFLSWLELLLLILSHPRTSVYIAMFKTVAWNTLKFILCYFILIVAFALSFHILGLLEGDKTNFEGVILSLFKTWIMSAGEYDAANIKFGGQFGIRHLFFAIFIFLIPIVLFNLSNGVAVSDIQRIRQEAEIVTTVSRVKSIAHMEVIISDLLSFLCKMAYYYRTLVRRHSDAEAKLYCDKLKQYYYRYINLFSTLSKDGKVYILPNQGNHIFMKQKIERRLTGQSSTYRDAPRLFISASTIEDIKRRCIYEEKATRNEITAEVTRAMTNLQHETEDRFQIIEEKLSKITELLKELSLR